MDTKMGKDMINLRPLAVTAAVLLTAAISTKTPSAAIS